MLCVKHCWLTSAGTWLYNTLTKESTMAHDLEVVTVVAIKVSILLLAVWVMFG